MKTTLLWIVMLIAATFVSCSTYNLTDKNKGGNGLEISGSTTNPVAVIDADTRHNVGKGQKNVLDATAEAKRKKAEGELAIDLSVAKFVDSLSATLSFSPDNAGEVAKIIQALALRDLYSQGFANVNQNYLYNSIQGQISREWQNMYYDPNLNPWR